MEHTAYTVQHGRTVVQGNNHILESRCFIIIDNGLNFGILFFNTFQKGRLVVLQFDLIKRRHAIRGLELGEERIVFRLSGTGVHHTTCS